MRLIFLLAALMLASPSDKAQCHSSCASCRVRCKQTADDVGACIRGCLDMKRQCCANCGAGPGPNTTCSCT